MKGNFENRYAYFRVGRDMIFIYSKSNVVLDLDMALSITVTRLNLQNFKPVSVFFDVDGIAKSEKHGRDFLAKCGWPLTARVAIYASSNRSAFFARYYKRVCNPVVDTQIFQNAAEAMAFLDSPRGHLSSYHE